MNDSGAWANPYGWSWRNHDRLRVVHAAIIHAIVADLDATYAGYVADENIENIELIIAIVKKSRRYRYRSGGGG